MDWMDYPTSWSPEYPYFFPKDGIGFANCSDQGPFAVPPGSPAHKNYAWCALEVDKDANLTFGQQVASNCMERLELAANHSAQIPHLDADGNEADPELDRPFFIGCGFHKVGLARVHACACACACAYFS